MRLLAFMGVSQNLIIVIAPISSVVVAMIFLYLGRNKLRGPKEDDISSMLDLESPMLVQGAQVQSPQVAAEVPEPEAEPPMVAAEVPEPEAEPPMVASEIPTSVQRVMNEIEKRAEIRCLVITAPSHGVLQDRLNNWLSGNYGRVVSTSMAMNEKGFFLTVFYEPAPVQ
jgi:hypothetical protein